MARTSRRCAVLLAVAAAALGPADVRARTSSVFVGPPAPQGGERFGAALDGDATTLVAGAPGTAPGGAVHVFARSGDDWALAATLAPADAAAGDEFGAAVALDGATLVVGAPGRDGPGGADAGAAFVFTSTGAGWVQQATLVPAGAAAGWRAGAAVDVAGDLVVVGAPGADPDGRIDAGAALAFAGGGAAWQPLPPVLDPATLEAGDLAGTGIATDGTTVVVGAPGRDGGAKLPDAGVAFAVERSGAAFGAAVRLVEPSPASSDRFGQAVDVRGDDLAVGVPSGRYADGDALVFAPGSVLTFRRTAGAWLPAARLSRFGPANTRGTAVRIAGTRLVSGAPFAQGPADVVGETAGAFVAFGVGGAWVDASDGLFADVDADERVTSGLGTSVALAGDTVAAGAPGLAGQAGRVYLFRSAPPAFTAPPAAVPAAATLLEPVAFAGAAEDPDGDAVAYFWRFGDGIGTAGSMPTHRYRVAGAFDVAVTANDGLAETTATVRVDVAAPSATAPSVDLVERYREYLAPVGGDGDGDGDGEERGGGGGERDVAADGRYKVKGRLALDPAHVAALDPATRFRLGLGRAVMDVALGDDPAFVAGATKARIALVDRGDEDEGSPARTYATLALAWRDGGLRWKLVAVTSQRFRFFTEAVLGEDLAGTPSGRRAGVLRGAVALGPATALFGRPYTAKVATVDREGDERSVYRSKVRVKARGPLVP